MTIFEKVKNFLKSDEPDLESKVPQSKTLSSFEDNDIYSTGAFFDSDYSSFYETADKATILEAQKNKIMLYRNLAKNPDVNNGIEEIVNEIIYAQDKDIMMIDLDEENEKVTTAVNESFKKIQQLINIDQNFYNMVRQSYIDGQLIIHCSYFKSLKDGIQKLKMVEPCYFYYDKNTEKWKYYTKDKNFYRQSSAEEADEYEREEIIRETFGIYEDQINLSYLEYAIKPSNQLKILEDLLIPLRFSRSVSRRVFNVDVGELQNTKAEEAMAEMQKKFKYKKFYNTDTGTISNQQHITSMVEDYWFANRSGAKGTTVDVLDETGNLGELNDILYFQKKLYKALKVPSNRITENRDGDNTFDYDSTAVTKEDIKFYMFISRVRKVYLNVFKELLKRELVSTGVMSLDDYYETYEAKINIRFTSESLFIEKLKLAQFQQKLDIYQSVQDYAGKIFPMDTLFKDIFKMDDDEIDETFKQIAKEKADSRYKDFYTVDDF